MNLKFSLAYFVYLIKELRSNSLHLSSTYAKIVMHSARLLNQVKKTATKNFRFTLLLSLSAHDLPSKAIIRSYQARGCLMVSGQLCGYVCFELLVERISFVCIR